MKDREIGIQQERVRVRGEKFDDLRIVKEVVEVSLALCALYEDQGETGHDRRVSIGNLLFHLRTSIDALEIRNTDVAYDRETGEVVENVE